MTSVVARTLWDARFVDMIEDAFERIQVPPSTITGGQLYSALRSVRYQLITWSAELQHAWSVESQTFDLTYGQDKITLPEGALAVSDATYRDAKGLDTPVRLMGREDYARIPDKTIIGDRPSWLWVDKMHPVGAARQLTAHLWQRPGTDTSQLILGLIMTAQDTVDDGPMATPEVPLTWFDALTAALAYRLAQKYKPEMEEVRRVAAARAETIARGSTEERVPFKMSWPSMKRRS